LDLYNLGKDELLMQSHYGKKVILFIPNSRWFGKRQWLMVHQAYEWDRINFSSPEKTAKVVEMNPEFL